MGRQSADDEGDDMAGRQGTQYSVPSPRLFYFKRKQTPRSQFSLEASTKPRLSEVRRTLRPKRPKSTRAPEAVSPAVPIGSQAAECVPTLRTDLDAEK